MQTSHLSSNDKQVLSKFRIKWCLSSYFSLPAKLLFIQSGIFAPIRAPPGRFDNIDTCINPAIVNSDGIQYQVNMVFIFTV